MRIHPRNNDEALFDLLSRSARHLVIACDVLEQIINADREERIGLRETLHAEENAADDSHHEFQRLINATFVTPLDREDLHLLGSTMDDCMDLVDEAGDCIVLYHVGVLPQACHELVDILKQCAELTAQAMPRLKSLKDLESYWVKINELENHGDQIYRAGIGRLFEEEMDTISLIKRKEIIERMEAAIDAFESLANTVESIAVRES
ncbi:phosphate transport regulator related to PhoU [Actinomyces sp. Chiba101]|uniref:Phosphate transport regulator n=1 Tax=Actinomyces denticolens TaxID=52767 RepID=A0ABY1IBG8_9ACTO|nr:MULTISPECIES: DUF47 family protein [Actinomyces]BAW92296.1 phosphate transport regulator related to PhoU [Actinomyces sp. Chiba101]GAV94765.1 phosphate transport regulator related to PhoU [Actinomyces denticolens]SHI94363.1 hypothetical protein SAMN05216246_107116 [Actinomyces denticolens]SUU10025.1 Phosphate transport regulator (distant homolog of PhoU) [Actinomyces denticolens]